MRTIRLLMFILSVSFLSGCATKNDGRSPDPAQSNDSESSGNPSNGLAPEETDATSDSTTQSSDTTQQASPDSN